jgi:hypothetical protein
MIRVPQLGSDPQIFATRGARLHDLLEAFANRVFVSIVARAIEMAIAGAGGFFDQCGRIGAIDLPHTQPDDGHLAVAR